MIFNKKKNLDIAKIQRIGSKASNMSSMIDSQFETEDYNYEEHKQMQDEINSQGGDHEDSHGGGFGSTLKIPLSKYKMLNN